MKTKVSELEWEKYPDGKIWNSDVNRYQMRDLLNTTGCGFCLAKWTQVTIHLGVGLTHSCHHVDTHKIPLDELKGNLILLPPSLSKGSYLKNFENIQTAFASGWMSIRALRKRSVYDKGFAISDHADWDGILEVVKKSEAKNVFYHHGDSEALSKYLVEKESMNVLFFDK